MSHAAGPPAQPASGPSPLTPSVGEGQALMAKITWRLLPFLMVLYVVSYLDRINLSFAALQMLEELKFSPNEFGQGSGIFFLGYCAFGIPSNLIIARLGPRKWVSLIMVVWGMITVAMCLVRDINSFLILRLVLGIAEAGFFPGMLLYLTYWFPPKQYGMAVARFMTAVPLAGLIGSLMAAKTLSMSGVYGLAGWKWLFILTGLPAVLLGVCVFFMLADSPAGAHWLSAGEKTMLTEMVAAGAREKENHDPDVILGDDKSDERSQASIIDAFKNLLVWRSALLYFSMSVCMYGFQLWLPQIVQTFQKMSDSETALLSALPALAQGLGMQVVALNSDRTGERRFHVIASCVITCLGLLSACLFDGPLFRLAGLSLAAFGIWGSVGPFWALTRQSLPLKSQPAGIAFINSVGGLGGYVGPSLVGFVQGLTPHAAGTSSFASSLILLAGAALFTASVAFLSKPPRRGETAD